MNIPPQVIFIILVAIAVGIYFYTKTTDEEDTTTTKTTTPVVKKKEEEEQEEKGPDDIAGLVGWWDGPSYDETSRTWKDKSKAKHDITDIAGTLEKTANGEAVAGTTETALTIPYEDWVGGDDYTFIYVAKYTGTGNRGRIFTGEEQNWISGFHSGRVGVAHRPGIGWITPQTSTGDGDDFIIAVDTRNGYRVQGIDVSYHGFSDEDDIVAEAPDTISINTRGDEKSDWTIREMLLYNRTLTHEEYTPIEKQLFEKYNSKTLRYKTITIDNKSTMIENEWPEFIQRTDVDCNKTQALTSFRLKRRGSGKSSYQYACMGGIDLDGSEVKGKTVDGTVEEKYDLAIHTLKVDCGDAPIQKFTYEVDDEDKGRYIYTCNNSKVKKDSCVTKYTEPKITGDAPIFLDRHNVACPPDTVMTSFRLYNTPPGTDVAGGQTQQYEYRCCKPEGF